MRRSRAYEESRAFEALSWLYWEPRNFWDFRTRALAARGPDVQQDMF